jgi:hypothetical protein
MDARGLSPDAQDGAAGIDGMTATDYEANLEANLGDLVARIKSGRYIGRRCDGTPTRTLIRSAQGKSRALSIRCDPARRRA